MTESCETKESCFKKMKLRIKGSLFQIAGILVGGIGGYIYYSQIGCVTGSCPITSNPFLSVLWGAVMGYLLSNVMKPKTGQIPNNEENKKNIEI